MVRIIVKMTIIDGIQKHSKLSIQELHKLTRKEMREHHPNKPISND